MESFNTENLMSGTIIYILRYIIKMYMLFYHLNFLFVMFLIFLGTLYLPSHKII